jgi:hypothetical protein
LSRITFFVETESFVKYLADSLATHAYLFCQALKADASLKRVAGMVKRLFQTAHTAPSNFACAVIFLVSEVRVPCAYLHDENKLKALAMGAALLLLLA